VKKFTGLHIRQHLAPHAAAVQSTTVVLVAAQLAEKSPPAVVGGALTQAKTPAAAEFELLEECYWHNVPRLIVVC
jgi:hypothetical protein